MGNGSQKYKDGLLSNISNGYIYVVMISILLFGYAIMGRGFAYLGFQPIYVGEIVLLASIILFILTPSVWQIFSSSHIKLLIVFMAWGLIRTFPYIQMYGILSLRDAAIWGYAIFGIIIAGFIVSNPARLSLLLNYYRKFIPIFAASMIILLALSLFITFPTTPGSQVSLVSFRGGTIMVHIAGAILFSITMSFRMHWGSIMLLLSNVIIWGSRNRGGLFALLVSITTIFFLKPVSNRLLKLSIGTCLFVFILILSGLESPTRKDRIIAPSQLITNIYSIFASGEDVPMQSSKAFRLEWWAEVIDYTIFGKYFWSGKGYGINLADDDGFQLFGNNSLRSPHNGHITILARSGIPGFFLWILLLWHWFWTLFRSYRKSNRLGQYYWANLFLFLMGFLLAFLANASFDVFLEGPMGGVWFWTVFGIGVAAIEIYKKYPDLYNSE